MDMMNGYGGSINPSRESGLGSDSDNMAELAALLNTEIPEGQSNLTDSHTNLERVAEYCEGNYFQAENKRIALEETKNYTTQSLASVAYQINTLAYNFLQLLDLQTSQLSEMESQMNHIAQTVMIHKEKVARREIGVLTANKTTNRQYKIIAPANPEKPIKYVRKPIDYNALDELGHGVRANTPRSKMRGSNQGSVQSLAAMAGPAPTTKPPTPPQVRGVGTLGKASQYRTPPVVVPPNAQAAANAQVGTLGRASHYRTPPAVAPPQVPSHYAPNYPLGHPRRSGAGYSTLPLAQPSQPQVGMVHPLPQTPPPPPPPTTTTAAAAATATAYEPHANMPPPPSPLTLTTNTAGLDILDGHQHLGRGGVLPHHLAHHRASPPLPPPPQLFPDADDHQFGQLASRGQPILGDEIDLPGWVPKNYIEKVVAIYDYYADKDDELSFQESSVIYVLKKNDDGWWEGVMDGITGLFPGNYVEPCV